jgi:uncharacterized protein (DUF983 family)
VGGALLAMLGRGVRLKCPRCGVGALYAKPFRMHVRCAHCDLKFEREQGYFVGAIYINYAATIAIAVPGFFVLDAFAGVTIERQLALWLPFAIVFPLLFFHHSRSLWLVLDHWFNPARTVYPLPPKKDSSRSSSEKNST